MSETRRKRENAARRKAKKAAEKAVRAQELKDKFDRLFTSKQTKTKILTIPGK